MSHLKPAVLIAVLGFALIPWLAQIELPGVSIPATYSQDFVPKVTGVLSSNQNLIKNTAYCIGLDAGPISPLVSGDYIQGIVTAAVASINVTNQLFTFQIYLGANGIVPSHAFGQGACASHTGSNVFSLSVVATLTGITFTPTRTFTVSRTSGTYWTWVEIIPATTDVKTTLVETVPADISLRDASKVGPSP